MADPVIIACPEGVWTKVATNQTTGVIHVLTTSAEYRQTYRASGGAVPTDETEAVPFDGSLQISAAAGIDVYVLAKVGDGSVRVDL